MGARFFLFFQKFQDGPHGSAIFLQILRRSAWERDFFQNFQDAPHGSAIFLKNFKKLRTGAHGSAILIIRERSGADQFSIESV